MRAIHNITYALHNRRITVDVNLSHSAWGRGSRCCGLRGCTANATGLY